MELRRNIESIYSEVEEVVGSSFVSREEHVLYVYSYDMTIEPPHMPDLVVMPRTVKEIQEILRIANKYKIPVVPFVCGTNVGGLTIPVKGGIILDLKRMDRVIEVNEEDMYAVIEPGVTFGQLKRLFNTKYRNLRYSWPYSPPFASVVANALLQGLASMSLKYGSNADMLNGLEVVLPTGELVRVGSCSVSPYWFGRHPLPDLAGLFIGWQGTTGIVTKAGIQLWPKPDFRDLLIAVIPDPNMVAKPAIEIVRKNIAEDIVVSSWALSKARVTKYPIQREEGVEAYLQVVISGSSRKEFEGKWGTASKIIRQYNLKPVELPEKEIQIRLNLPSNVILGWIDHRAGGGLTWVGSYVPMSRWVEGYRKGTQIMERYGFSPMIFMRAMREGHYGVLRYLVPFNKGSAKEKDKVKDMCRELCKLVLDIGGIPYKPPIWMAEMIQQRMDRGCLELMKKIKKLLDPNGVMNPGRLCLK